MAELYVDKTGINHFLVRLKEVFSRKADIVNDLETGGDDVPLSAEQGVELKSLIDAIDERVRALEGNS